jgi:hypothetical protein
MSRQFAFAAPMIALAALSVPTIFSSSSYAAETCLAAPQGTAPQGSHWYYRLDRATQRKCWRLVKLDGQPRRTAKQVAPPPQPVEEENASATQTSVERIPQSAPQQGWLTRSASAVPEAIAPPPAASDPSGDRAENQASAAPPPVPEALSVPSQPEQTGEATAPVASVPAVESQQANVAAKNPPAAPAGMSLLQFVFVAIAAIGLLGAAIFALVDVRRRRTDVLTRISHEDETSFEQPEAEDAPTFAALPPMRLAPQHDDVDEALQRLRRRRMAA